MSDQTADPRDDLPAELNALDDLLARLDEAQWRIETDFKRWTVFDHVGHLVISERTALHALDDPQRFAAEAAEITRRALIATDWTGKAVPALGAVDGAAMRALWSKPALAVADRLGRLPREARVPWYGPAMSPIAFASARLMETWAHGETIRDAIGIDDPGSARLRHVCELGWRTRGFALMVHGLPADPTPIGLDLIGPRGERWQWDAPAAANRIVGSARDFARVVCQCRSIVDTDLRVEGGAAARWMDVAQCFVGGPSRPPAPGTRRTRHRQEIAR